MTLAIILLIASLILAILATLNIPSTRINMLAAAFACFVGYVLLTQGMVG